MSAIFGQENRQPAKADNDNPLGLNRAGKDDKKKKEDNSPFGEQAPENNQGQPQTNQEDPQAEAQEPKEETRQPEEQPTQTDKEQLIAGKFKSKDALIQSLANLGEKIGRKIDMSAAMDANTQDLVDEYKALESEMGQTSDIDKLRQQNQELKQEKQQTEERLNKVEGYLNNVNKYLRNLQAQQQQGNQQQQPQQQQMQQPNQTQPARDPQTGQFRRQQQPNNQQGTSQQQQDNSLDNIDKKQFRRKLMTDPVNAVKEIMELTQQQQTQLKNDMSQNERQQFQQGQQQMQQGQQQMQQPPQQQRRQQQRYTEQFNKQIKQLKQKYGEDKIKDPEIQKQMVDFMSNNRHYLNPGIFPNGAEIAYQHARKVVNNKRQSQDSQQDRQRQADYKKAAQVPRSSANTVRAGQGDKDKVQKEKDMIFRANKGGMFGRK